MVFLLRESWGLQSISFRLGWGVAWWLPLLSILDELSHLMLTSQARSSQKLLLIVGIFSRRDMETTVSPWLASRRWGSP